MKYSAILIAMALLLGLPGLAASPGKAAEAAPAIPAGMGLLTGVVTRGPVSPVQGPGLPAGAAPAEGVELVIYGPGRREVATARTDTAGRYRVNLPPGAYLIDLHLEKGRGFTKDLPATVTITPGRETRLDLRIDTGIR